MKKKMWREPSVEVQEFVPNEYVAACFELQCHRGSEGNSYDLSHWGYRDEYGGVSHSPMGTPATCGDASANRVITSDGGSYESVGEYNGQQGWINGRITDWVDSDKSGSVTTGDIIFWYTVSSDRNRRWNHWGTVGMEDTAHPNHS